MLTIIYGHSGSGKSKYIYDEMKKDAEIGKRAYLIVPEQETVSCERTLLDMLPSHAQLTCEILNFSRLANLVFRQYGGLSYNYADKNAKTLIMWKILRSCGADLKEYSSSTKKSNIIHFAEEMLSTVEELKAYNVSTQKLDKVYEAIDNNDKLKNKLYDLSLITSNYSEALNRSYSDASDDLSKLVEKIKDRNFFKGANVYIDSFSSFTRQEKDVIEEILKSADNTIVALPTDSLSSTQIHYESATVTARYLVDLAKDHSIRVFEKHLGACTEGSEIINSISAHLWDHSVSNLETEISDTLRIIQASDPYEESEAVANIIREMMTNGIRCKDIAVIARDASLYKGIIDTALEKADIPYFFSQNTDIMSKASVKFLLSALKIKIRGWRREDVMEYLKSDLGGFDRHSIDVFECYAEMWDIRGKAFTDGNFTMNPDGYAEELTEQGNAILTEVNQLKNSFVPPLLKLFARLESAACASEMCQALYLFAENNKISETLKKNADAEYKEKKKKEAAESLQIYNILVRSLESISKIFGNEKIDVQEFYDALKIILCNTSIGSIPTGEDQVTVGSASMLRTGNIKCAIVIGLNEGEFPQGVKDTSIFSDNDKAALKDFDIFLSPDTSTRASDELFYVYRAMSSPKEKLVLLYHSFGLSNEKAFPSMAVERIKNLFKYSEVKEYSKLPIEKTVFSPEFAFERLPYMPDTPYSRAIKNYFNSKNSKEAPFSSVNSACDLSEITSNTVFGSTLRLTQTVIDKYMGCPFEYMCSNLFSINDRTKAEFEYRDFGTYVHYILENFVKEAAENGHIGNEPDKNYISDSVNRIADAYFKKVFASGAITNARLLHRFERMRRLAVLVATNITKEFADSKFRPAFFELSIGRKKDDKLCLPPLILPLDDKRKVSLVGQVDRVDILHKNGNVYVRVVDYKTGEKKFSRSNLKKAKDVQLPLYLFSLCDDQQTTFKEEVGCPESGKMLPAGAMYFSSHIDKVDISDSCPIDSVKDTAEASFKRVGFLLYDEEILLDMSNSFSQDMLCGISRSTAKPKKGENPKLKGNAYMPQELSQMKDELKTAVSDVANKIMSGQMSPSPSYEDSKLRCDRCSMNWICRAAKKFKT